MATEVGDGVGNRERGEVFSHFYARDEVVSPLNVLEDRSLSAVTTESFGNLLNGPAGDVDSSGVDSFIAQSLDQHPRGTADIENSLRMQGGDDGLGRRREERDPVLF